MRECARARGEINDRYGMKQYLHISPRALRDIHIFDERSSRRESILRHGDFCETHEMRIAIFPTSKLSEIC